MKLSHLLVAFVGVMLLSTPLAAQESLYSEIDAKWKLDPTSQGPWASTFGSSYRSRFYDSGEFRYKTEFLQLSVAPSFAINSVHSVSLEFRYRIKELFDSQLTDEKRFSQQYTHRHEFDGFSLKGRLRVEERFRESFNLRSRYQLGVSYVINKNSNPLKEWLLTADTEFLWSVSSEGSSTFDQRVSLALAKPLSEVITFKLKPQYRYVDYTHEGRNIWRAYAILSIAI